MVALTRFFAILVAVICLAGSISFFAVYGSTDTEALTAAATQYATVASGAAGNTSWVPLSALAAVLAGALALGCSAMAKRWPSGEPERWAVPVSSPAMGRVRPAELREVALSLERRLIRDSNDIAGLLEELVFAALDARASDIHIHPLPKGTRIAFRIDGVLREVALLAPTLHSRLIMRLKIVAELVTYRASEPQDGHFVVERPKSERPESGDIASVGAPAEIRVSLLPTNHGETAVLRVGGADVRLPDLGGLGFPAPLLHSYKGVLQRSQGLVFLTGPTGSGKTTTIYASLGEILETQSSTTHIATIEDPIEFNVPALSQTQVQPAAGLDFARGLRSLLRQDPNVLMVGEIRDAETASIASQAGLTGHLILTTVHADSAAGVFNRLIEIGVEPFVVASASQASLSQRLVRRLCEGCREPTQLSPEEIDIIGGVRAEIPVDGFFAAPGCEACGGSGFSGRAPLFEMLTVSPAVRDLITQKVPTSTIHQAAIDEGMVPLFEAGLTQAAQGITSMAEALRVAR